MIVICAGTSGYDTLIDVRYLWYLQKRYQGSHLMNTEQAAAFNDLVRDGTIETTLGAAYPYDQIPHVHHLMEEGGLPEERQLPGERAPDGAHDVPLTAGARVRPLSASGPAPRGRRPSTAGWTNAINVFLDPCLGTRSTNRAPCALRSSRAAARSRTR